MHDVESRPVAQRQPKQVLLEVFVLRRHPLLHGAHEMDVDRRHQCRCHARIPRRDQRNVATAACQRRQQLGEE